MYFWTALLAFGGVAASVAGGPARALSIVAALSALALVVTALPRLRRGRHPVAGL
ncbi:MAG: hypothetical protein JWL64_1205, partial [Frankiales bacterium]|nr:hypothetical protein [Frankiales bacterium]